MPGWDAGFCHHPMGVALDELLNAWAPLPVTEAARTGAQTASSGTHISVGPLRCEVRLRGRDPTGLLTASVGTSPPNLRSVQGWQGLQSHRVPSRIRSHLEQGGPAGDEVPAPKGEMTLDHQVGLRSHALTAEDLLGWGQRGCWLRVELRSPSHGMGVGRQMPRIERTQPPGL